MIRLGEQEKLFARIGSECTRPIEAVVMGGSAMLFYNLAKTATKDIDLLLEEKDRAYLVIILSRLGFREVIHPQKQGDPFTMVLGDYRLDLFAGQLFKLKLSPGIQGRLKEKIQFGALTVAVAAPEDIILSKSMTDRPGDREDAASIISKINVRWDVIGDECRWQSTHDKRFPVFLYDFVDELVHQFSISVPEVAVKEIKKMCREFMESLASPKGK